MIFTDQKSTYLEDITDASKYFSQIAGLPLLSREREVELFKAYQASGRKSPALRSELAEANVRFVVSLAKKYIGRGVNLIDLIQEGNVGLMKAIDHFEYQRGNRFISYGVWWIRQAITEAIQEQTRMIHIPANRLEGAYRSRRKSDGYFMDHGDKIPEKELRRLGIDPEETVQEFEYFSLDQEVSGGSEEGPESRTYHDTLSKNGDFTEELEVNEIKDSITKVFEAYVSVFGGNNAKLKRAQTEVKVLKMRFGLNGYRPLTLKDAGKRLGVSRERVRQIQQRGMPKLRRLIRHLSGSEPMKNSQELSDMVSA